VLASLLAFPVAAVAQAATPAPAPAASPVLGPMTDDQIQGAIARGNKKKPEEIGLTMTDRDTSDFAGMECHNCGDVYYQITIYTPLQWIEATAATAKATNKKFTLADVTDAMREPVLHVVAKEIRDSLNLTASNVKAQISKVGIADQAKTSVIAPLTTKTSDNPDAKGTGFNGYVSTSTAFSVFSLKSLAPVMSNDKAEFYVVLTVENRTKFEKLKVKDVKQAMNEGCKACGNRPWPI
jgi:hypothetical protein